MQCHHVKALDEFFKGIQSEPVKIAVVGCGCSIATEPVAEISHQWNISQVYKLYSVLDFTSLSTDNHTSMLSC